MRSEGGNPGATARSLAGRERLIVLSGLAVMLVLGAAHLYDSSPGAAASGSATHGWLVFGMWAGTMVAVMAPAAAPAMLARSGGDASALPAFLAGHLALWTCVSATGALAHWGLHAAGIIAPDEGVESPLAGGILLMSAGAYQLMPRKATRQSVPRATAASFADTGRDAPGRAFAAGARHAAHCVGRRWLLMALLFVGGVMDPLWIAVLTPIAMADEILPYGEPIAHAVAAGAIGWGLWMLAGMLV